MSRKRGRGGIGRRIAERKGEHCTAVGVAACSQAMPGMQLHWQPIKPYFHAYTAPWASPSCLRKPPNKSSDPTRQPQSARHVQLARGCTPRSVELSADVTKL